MGPDSHQNWCAPRARPTTTLHKISTLALSPFLRNIHFIFFLCYKISTFKKAKKKIDVNILAPFLVPLCMQECESSFVTKFEADIPTRRGDLGDHTPPWL